MYDGPIDIGYLSEIERSEVRILPATSRVTVAQRPRALNSDVRPTPVMFTSVTGGPESNGYLFWKNINPFDITRPPVQSESYLLACDCNCARIFCLL